MPEIEPPAGYVPVTPPAGYVPAPVPTPPPAGYVPAEQAAPVIGAVSAKAAGHLAGGGVPTGETTGPGVGDFLNRAFNPVPLVRRLYQEHWADPMAAANAAAAPYVQRAVEAPRQVAEGIAPGAPERILGKYGMAAMKGGERAVEGLATPENAALGAVIGGAPRALARLTSAGFSLQMLKGAIEQDPELKAAWESKDVEKLIELAIPRLGLLAMGTSAGVHAAGGIPKIGRAAGAPRVEEPPPAEVAKGGPVTAPVPERSQVEPPVRPAPVEPPAGYVEERAAPPAPVESTDILSRENLRAGFLLPDGRKVVTGPYHDWSALPKEFRAAKAGEVERIFVDGQNNVVTLSDLQNRIVAGERGGTGEATIGPAEAAPPTEAVKAQGKADFDIDFDELARQAQEARREAPLQGAEADHDRTVQDLAQRGLAERADRAGQDLGDGSLQDRGAGPVGRGREAVPGGRAEPTDEELAAAERAAIQSEHAPIEEGGATKAEIEEANRAFFRDNGLRTVTPAKKAERAGKPGKIPNWARPAEDQVEKPLAFQGPLSGRWRKVSNALSPEEQQAILADLSRAREREATKIRESGVPIPPQVIAENPEIARPVEEFSPAASERQRLIEERDARAARKAPTGKAPVQGDLGLSKDYGRKGDQQELGAGPPAKVMYTKAEAESTLRMGGARVPPDQIKAEPAAEGYDPEVQKRLDAEEAAFEADRARAKALREQGEAPAKIVNSDAKPTKSFVEQVEEIEKKADETNPLADKIGLRMKHGTPGGAEPERNYTDKIIVGNDALKQTQRASPESAEAWRRVPVAPKRAGHVMADAYDRVNKAYGSSDGWDIHQRVVHASQLEGKANDYANLASDIAAMPTDKVIEFYGNDINALVDAIGAKSRFKPGRTNEMRVTADKLFRKGDGQGLRDHLMEVFTRAASAAQASADAVDLDGKTLQEWIKDPKWQASNKVYKETLGKLLEEEHAEHQGRFLSADSLGPAQTYMPMLAPKDATWGKAITAFRRPFAPRGNPWNRMRTGLSQEYDLGNEALTKAVGRGLRSLATKDALETDRKLGLIQDIKENEQTPPAIAYQGRSFVRSEPFETTSPKTVLREGGGKPGQIPPKRAITPEWHHREIKQIMGGERQDWKNPALQAARDAITKSALYGAFDMAFHSTNVAATSLSRVPVIGSNMALRVAQQVPGFGMIVKPLALAEHLRKMDPFSEKASGRSGLTGKELFDKLVEAGVIPDRYARETYSKQISKATGAKVVRYNLSAALIGPKGLDIRARMLLLDDLLARNPKATNSEIHSYVNNLGNYVYQLNSPHMRAVKKAGLSSFVTAGKAMNTNAIQSLLATGKDPTTGREFAKGKAQLLANSSLIAAAATWVALHKAYRDEYPWEDSDSKLLAIRVKDEDRDKPWAKFLFSKQELEGNTPLYVSPTDLLQPFTARGMRAAGMRAFLETLYRGGNFGQALEHGSTEAANTALHPYAGPVAQATSRMIGFEPYIQTQHERGRPVISFRSSVQEDTPPGLKTLWARGKSAVVGLNPSARGFEYEPEPGKGTPPEAPPWIPDRLVEGGRYTTAQVLTPRLARHHTSLPSAEAKRLRKEQDYFARRGLD